jgi:hypothetical protein
VIQGSEHGQRPLSQQHVLVGGREQSRASLRNGHPSFREHVLGTERMAVAWISRDEAERKERVERPAQGVASHSERPGEGRESRSLLREDLREHGRRPPVMEERDQVRD